MYSPSLNDTPTSISLLMDIIRLALLKEMRCLLKNRLVVFYASRSYCYGSAPVPKKTRVQNMRTAATGHWSGTAKTCCCFSSL